MTVADWQCSSVTESSSNSRAEAGLFPLIV